MRYVADGCGGELLSGSPAATIGRVCTDSRQARPGDLFIALAGDKFDGETVGYGQGLIGHLDLCGRGTGCHH